MSNQITTAFVNQFSANITLLAQQTGSMLRSAVNVESVTGEKCFFEQIGKAAAVQRVSRHSDTPLVETPHSRRMVTLTSYEWADLVDDADKIRMLIDPASTYARAAAAAISRSMDTAIIDAMTGSANTGASGSTSTTLPAGQKIAHGSAGLTLVKLVSAKKILDQNDIDPSIPRYIVVSPEQTEDLLNNSTVTSADYNSIKALVRGEIDTFLGFKFITSNRLNDDGTSRQVVAWAQDGMALAIGAEPSARITERDDKSYSTQIYYSATFGATRLQEEMVVEIACNE